jgi:hypothetical protein
MRTGMCTHIRAVGIHIRLVGIHMRVVCIHMRMVGIHMRSGVYTHEEWCVYT